MTTERYTLLMTNVDEIAGKVKLFAPEAQSEVFRAFHSALMDERIEEADGGGEAVGSSRKSGESSASVTVGGAADEMLADWNEDEELAKLADEHGLREINGIEFGAVAVYFYTVLAPEHARLQSISVTKFEEACMVIGHPVGNAAAALANGTRKHRRYVKGGKRDGYTLTGHGKNFVMNSLLKHDE